MLEMQNQLYQLHLEDTLSVLKYSDLRIFKVIP